MVPLSLHPLRRDRTAAAVGICAMAWLAPFLARPFCFPHLSTREYALLAVRNLCEGNPANQALIAALQPQGCAPDMDEALADMGLEGHIDAQEKFRLAPRPSGV